MPCDASPVGITAMVLSSEQAWELCGAPNSTSSRSQAPVSQDKTVTARGAIPHSQVDEKWQSRNSDLGPVTF